MPYEKPWVEAERLAFRAEQVMNHYPRCDVCGRPCCSGKVVEVTTRYSTLHYCDDCAYVSDAENFYIGEE